jgi:hypothetical protein
MSATAKPVNKKHGLLGLSGRSVRVGSIGNRRPCPDAQPVQPDATLPPHETAGGPDSGVAP